jgi:HSP20 family molecular chaperone IbpA
VDPERITAQLSDGVLRLEIAKIRPRATRRARGERLE